MTTDTYRECLTPEAYADLREYLDASGKWANTPWPCVLFLVDDGPSVYDPAETARRERELRAAWWQRLTAPRREAHADPEADAALELADIPRNRFRHKRLCGWSGRSLWISGAGGAWRWLHEPQFTDDSEVHDVTDRFTREGLTTRQLRARLAFDGATGVESGAGRIYPEAVPQREPGALERCGCVVNDGRPALAYCKWCDGTGEVIDGRKGGGEDSIAVNPCGSGPRATERELDLLAETHVNLPRRIAAELAYRATKPDAFGHPHYLRTTERELREGQLAGIARAPLLELLHPRNP